MKRSVFLLVILFFTGISILQAQAPMGRTFGFGLVLGDPTGFTGKFWTAPDQAITASIGGSYFGVPRIDLNYLWHFNAFNSRIVNLYGGIGAAIGFGREGWAWGWHKRKFDDDDVFYYREEGEVGVGGRLSFGVNIVPRRVPFEFFLELGGLMGFIPDFGFGVDAAAGVRFYP